MPEDNADLQDSEGSHDIPDPSSSKPGAKRRASRAGTRSVASLTPEQLARKRANDREAQRSTRQRTKNHIKDLERRNLELSREEETQTLEDVRRRNAELEEELRSLRGTLARSAGSVAPSTELAPLSSRYGKDMIDSPYSYLPQWSSPDTSLPPSSPFAVSNASELMSSLAPNHSTIEYDFSDLSSAGSDAFISTLGIADTTSTPPHLAPSASRRGMPFNQRPHLGRSRSSSNGRLAQTWQRVASSIPSSRLSSGMSQPPGPSSNPSRLDGTLVRIGSPPHEISHHIAPPSNPLGFETSMAEIISPMARQLQPTLAMNSNIAETSLTILTKTQLALGMNRNTSEMHSLVQRQTQGIDYDPPSTFVNQSSLHTGEFGLRFAPLAGSVDSDLIGLLHRQRYMTGTALTGPYHPNLRCLLDLQDSASTHQSSDLADLIRRSGLRGLAEKAAVLHIIYCLVQWQISPSAETYNHLPDWYDPRASQLQTGHPIWSILVVWGNLRDIVINDQDNYATDEFQHLFTCSLNINWPYRDQDITIFEGDEARISDGFRTHIYTQSNWSLDEPFQRRYPELRNACKFSGPPGQQAQLSV
ncbi:hypothetical protein EG329_009835 [Mollisiaceae sp. DMI_Dod_QoI]|nr:hypothetical protein EG329_009835 [Helotiales sp. DMI_Dod_QoI]